MKLYENWSFILRKAWSIRFALLAGLFSAGEVALPLFANEMPRGLFAGLAALAATGSVASRIVAQKGM